jgi:hypothetical protein
MKCFSSSWDRLCPMGSNLRHMRNTAVASTIQQRSTRHARITVRRLRSTSSMMKRTWTKRFLVQCWSCGVLTAWLGRSTTFSLFGRIGRHEYQARPCRAGIGWPKSYVTGHCLRSRASLRPSWTPGGHVAVHESFLGHEADRRTALTMSALGGSERTSAGRAALLPLLTQAVWKCFSSPKNCKQPGAMDLDATV